MHLVSHVRLELELCRWAEGRGIHFHEPLSVASWVQTVHGIFNDVKTLMARRLKVVFG